jgi:hypothetical protein
MGMRLPDVRHMFQRTGGVLNHHMPSGNSNKTFEQGMRLPEERQTQGWRWVQVEDQHECKCCMVNQL